jgi:hypothetical protein
MPHFHSRYSSAIALVLCENAMDAVGNLWYADKKTARADALRLLR